MKKHATGTAALGVALLAIFALVLSGSRQSVDDDFFALRKNFEIFGSLYENLAVSYVDPVDPERLMRRGISAMLEELDPYTVFIDESDYLNANIQRARGLGTVGLDLDYRDDRLTVLSPIDGGAAFRQGIRVGDAIDSVAGRPTSELTRGDVLELLSGDPGTVVDVVISRPGEDASREFSLTREVIRTDPVTYAGFVPDDRNGGIAYLHLANFNPGSDDRVRGTLRELNRENRLSAVVLDLRDNQGGLLEAAVSIVQLFVPEGSTVVTVRGRRPEDVREYRTMREPAYPDVQLFVLINRRSASASEIVAGAIQDLDRGVVIGETSFGKGLAQVVRELPFNTGIKVTTSKFYAPSGRNVQAINYRMHGERLPDSLRVTFTTVAGRTVRGGGGIEPDIVVASHEPGPLESALLQDGAFFRYAGELARTIGNPPAIPEPSELDVPAFQAWLDGREFDYEMPADRLLRDLRADVGSATDAAGALEVLDRVVTERKRGAFEIEEGALQQRLFYALTDRVAAETSTLYRARLPHDTDIAEVRRLVADRSRYDSILSAR